MADDLETEYDEPGQGTDGEGSVAAPRAQILITGSWLTMKEVGLLAAALARCIPSEGAPYQGSWWHVLEP